MVPAGSTERKPDSEIVGCFQERVKGWGFPSLQGRCHLLSWWTEECPPGLRHLLEEQAWSSVRSQWGKWWGRVCFWCGRMDQSLYHSQEPPAWRSGWVLQPCTLQRSFLLVCVQIRVLERAPLKKKKKSKQLNIICISCLLPWSRKELLEGTVIASSALVDTCRVKCFFCIYWCKSVNMGNIRWFFWVLNQPCIPRNKLYLVVAAILCVCVAFCGILFANILSYIFHLMSWQIMVYGFFL